MTKEEARQAALRWLDEATAGGRPLAEESTADWLERMDHLLDSAVAAVCSRFPHHAVYRAVCSPPRNLAPAGQRSARVWPPESYTLTAEPFSSYTLEVQGEAAVRLLAGKQVLREHSVGSPEAFARVDGVLPQAADRLQITGECPFLVRGVGLYPDRYPEKAVPPWGPYWIVQLPPDFAALEQVLYSGDGAAFARFSDYRRVGDGAYAVPRELCGQLDFYYIRTPRLLGAKAAADTELDVRPAAACLVPLRLAADLVSGVDESAALSEYLCARYNELAASLYRSPQPERGAVECVYAQ